MTVTADEAIRRALNPATGATTITEMDGAEVIGAASYRYTERGVKLVNIGSKRKGVGRKLFNAVHAKACEIEHWLWCQSDPDAVGFYKKMGMQEAETLPDGRVIYILTGR